jgi:hypothetical protein
MKTKLGIGLLALFAAYVLGSAPFNIMASEATVIEEKSLAHEGSEVPAASVSGAPYSPLDIAGDWTITYGYTTGFPLTSPRSYRVHFDVVGPGAHGGKKFRGRYTDPPGQPGTFEGETVFSGRGVALVQMLVSHPPVKYLEVLCGKHVVDPQNPAKVSVLGAWSSVGYATGPGGSGYLANFEMVKLPTQRP